MNSPFFLTTLHPATGPLKGMSEIIRAAEAAVIDITLGSQFGSKLRRFTRICVSLVNQSANIGLSGLSIRRDVSFSCVLGWDSLLRNPPGNLPAA